jgi:hypothetical protein
MNGTESKIEIFTPFGKAFELMKKILFQPFEFKKWLVIGFAAWLANLGDGVGGGGNLRFPDDRREDAQKLNELMGQIPQPILITGICVLICVVLLLIVLFAWLRARGRFIFVDCVVRNRAAIVEPWKEFRAEGNSFFLFSLVVALVLITTVAIAGLVLVVPFIPRGTQAQPGGNLRELLHRCDSVRRLGHPSAGVSDAWRVFAPVPATVRFGLRRLGGLYAAGIFTATNAATFFCD